MNYSISFSYLTTVNRYFIFNNVRKNHNTGTVCYFHYIDLTYAI